MENLNSLYYAEVKKAFLLLGLDIWFQGSGSGVINYDMFNSVIDTREQIL